MKIESVESLLSFITAIRQTDRYIVDIYTNGACYKFHLLIKEFCSDCRPMMSKARNHIVTEFNGRYFDITGEVYGEFDALSVSDIEVVSKWSFANNCAIAICECHVCGEPIVV